MISGNGQMRDFTLEEYNQSPWHSEIANIKKVIIVDDIYTTGTTIETMSKILKENGVDEVYFVCIAVVDNV